MSELTVIKGPSRESIVAFENHLKALPQVHIEPQHFFAPGLYARQIDIKAGTLLTGKEHKEGHLNVLAHGEIVVLTEDGMKHLKAPAVIPARAGTKRVGYAVTDCTWITIHATEKVDVQEIEHDLIEPDNALEAEAQPCLG